jgi:hypothetical protein
MLPVNPRSALSASAWVDTVNAAKCMPKWMKNIFSAKGHDLRIAPSYSGPKASIPAWFATWHNAASSVYMGSFWDLTTGTLERKSNDVSIMVPDGVSIGKVGPDNTWVDYPQVTTQDKWEGGITVPTQEIKNTINQAKDKKLHYSGVIVKPGSKQGEIVVVTQIKDLNGQLLKLSDDEIIETLFHELFHAGQVDQQLPDADDDPRFNVITDAIKSFFVC